MVLSASTVAWAHVVPPVLLETPALKAQRVLRALLEVLGPEAILDSPGLMAPRDEPVQEAQQATAQIRVIRVLPASMAHPVLAVPMARSVIWAVKAPPVARVLQEDAATPALVVTRALRAQRAPLGLSEEPVKKDLPEIPAPTVIWAKPGHKDCEGPRVHPATPAILALLALLAALVPRVREAIQVIRVLPAPLAQPVVLVPEVREVILAILALRATRAQQAQQALKGLAVRSV
jgi:hypothetical protein